MAERGEGTIIFVLGSETRGGPAQYSAYTGSKLAQRAIAESLAYEFGHLGVHTAALDVDGAVDSARVREAMPEVDASWFVSPQRICAEILHLIHQPQRLVDLPARPALVLAMAPARGAEEESLANGGSRREAIYRRYCFRGGATIINGSRSGRGADW